MRYLALYDLFFMRFLKDYKDEQACNNDRIDSLKNSIIDIIGKENSKLVETFKYSIINHMQELEMENMNKSFNYGILVGLEVQEIINEYEMGNKYIKKELVLANSFVFSI